MTVEPTYRFEAIDGHSENRPLIARATNGTVIGRWVPDTRLQEIADEYSGQAVHEGDWEKLIELLSALVEEGNDEG